MTWQVMQTRRFMRVYKKLPANLVRDVDQAVADIATNPDIGDKKKGDLAALFVYKFRSQNQLYRLGYTRDGEIRIIYLQSIGSHENFHRDLKR